MRLQISALGVAIDGVPVLRDVGLSVDEGEMVGLIGRNGAGKTTLMRAVMGLIAAGSGSIRVDGRELRGEPGWRRAGLGVSYMPEDRRLIPELTVEENVLVPAWAGHRRDAAERLRRVYRLIPEVESFRDRRALQLSGGQQKLVALARALVAGERLLLLDEPFEGVAPVLSRRLAEVIDTLRGEGLSVILAESDDTHSADLVSRIYRIERGVVTEAAQELA